MQAKAMTDYWWYFAIGVVWAYLLNGVERQFTHTNYDFWSNIFHAVFWPIVLLFYMIALHRQKF